MFNHPFRDRDHNKILCMFQKISTLHCIKNIYFAIWLDWIVDGQSREEQEEEEETERKKLLINFTRYWIFNIQQNKTYSKLIFICGNFANLYLLEKMLFIFIFIKTSPFLLL